LQERIKQGFNDSPKGACLELTMQLIETKTLGTAAASIEFTSIPQDATDLVLSLSLRNTGAFGLFTISFNGSTTGFSVRGLYGDGASAGSFTSPANYAGEVVNSLQTSNTFANNSLYVPNYTGSTNKSYSIDGVQENNGTTSNQVIGAGLWSNTAAITSLTIGTTNTFSIGSMVSLYKITKGSSGGVVVS
jgi:hypothetical protein